MTICEQTTKPIKHYNIEMACFSSAADDDDEGGVFSAEE